MENNKNIFASWFLWQFYEMPIFLLNIWNNYFLFALNYFSLPVLLKSLFSPWHRYRWVYPRGFDIGQIATTFLSNLFSRIMGAIARVSLIAVGILLLIFTIFAGAAIFLLWMLMPFIIILGALFIFYI